MAHTKVTKNGTQNTGTANTFSYSGSFDVFKADEVEVELDNVALTFTTSTINESATPREYTVDYTAKEIHIGGANLASSNSVVIQPVTDMGAPTPRATYAPGASVTSEDLNNNQLQLMRKAMEYDEQKLSSRGGTMTGNLHFGKDIDITFEGDTDNNHEITLTVADPTSDKIITLPDTTGTVITTGDTGTVARGMIANDAINGDKIANDSINSEHYVDGSIDTQHIADGQITTAQIANGTIINEDIDSSAGIVGTKLAGRTVGAAQIALGAITDAEVDNSADISGSKIADNSIALAKMTANSVDTTQLVNDSVTADKIADAVIVTNSEHAAASVNDTTFFTTSASDGRYFRQDSSETIATGNNWTGSDAYIATTGAIDLRIIELVDDVGGFVPIADELNFPNANPDINSPDGYGTIVSIQSIDTSRTPAGGTVTIANGTVGNSTVTITNCGTTVLPAGYGVLVETTPTLNTYRFHRLTPKSTEVSTVAANAVAVSTVATNVSDINNFYDLYQISTSAPTARADSSSLQVGDLWFDSSSNKVLMIYDGSAGDGFTAATPNASDLVNINIVAGQITYQEDLGLITNSVSTGTGNNSVNTVAGSIANVNTVAGIASNVTTVAGNNANVTTVAGKATEIGRLGTADAVADMNTLGTNAIVSDMDTLADISSNITTVAGISSNVTTVAGISSNVTAVAGNATNINAVAADATDIGAVAGKATEIGRLGTADAVADLAILGTTDVVADMNTLATSANVTAMDNCSDDIANINTVSGSITNVNTTAGSIANVNTAAGNISNVNTVAGISSNVTTVAGIASNVTTVAGSISNVNTTASNINNVNNFAATYQIASSDPSTDGAGNALAEGDLYFNTTSNELRVYNGSSFQGGVTATGNLAGLGANTFTGDQTVNANITATGNVNCKDITLTDTTPGISFVDSNNNSDFRIIADNGVLSFADTTNNANRINIQSDGHVDIVGNLDVGAGVDVTGNITVTGTVDGKDVSTLIANVVEDTTPQLGGALDGQNNNMSNIGTIDGSNLQLDFGTI